MTRQQTKNKNVSNTKENRNINWITRSYLSIDYKITTEASSMECAQKSAHKIRKKKKKKTLEHFDMIMRRTKNESKVQIMLAFNVFEMVLARSVPSLSSSLPKCWRNLMILDFHGHDLHTHALSVNENRMNDDANALDYEWHTFNR